LRNNYNVDLGLQLLIDNKGVNEYIKDFYIKSWGIRYFCGYPLYIVVLTTHNQVFHNKHLRKYMIVPAL